jgi:hypothetical protein
LVDTKHKNEALNALNEGLFKFDWNYYLRVSLG